MTYQSVDFFHVIFFFLIFLKGDEKIIFLFNFKNFLWSCISILAWESIISLQNKNTLNCASQSIWPSQLFLICSDWIKKNLILIPKKWQEKKTKTFKALVKHSNFHRYCLFHLLLKFRPKILLTFFTLSWHCRCLNFINVFMFIPDMFSTAAEGHQKKKRYNHKGCNTSK